jgi:ADP-ribose pyrophosphatase
MVERLLLTWKTLERRHVLDRGRFLQVEDHTVELPDGRVIEPWPWLDMPNYTNTVVETADGLFLFFRQTKYAVAAVTLAPVGGYLEPDEDPLAGAQRELLEETGYAAPEWHALGRFACDGNRGAGVAHLFLARAATHVAERNADDLEEQELLRLTRAETSAALFTNEFKVLGWAANVALALLALDRLAAADTP